MNNITTITQPNAAKAYTFEIYFNTAGSYTPKKVIMAVATTKLEAFEKAAAMVENWERVSSVNILDGVLA